ncbi:hypothetical protein GCM10009104_14360 [Marinobacterium maritimum]|uniref:Cell division protein ZipA n=1 Tax=Marinobacterium maritimum TaxID=500162 RepID=A0ABP3TAV0_9GAMM
MDISLREWLIIGGVLIVILILVDGWRRVSANRSRLRLEIDRTLSELAEDDAPHNPELPNGGARVRDHEGQPQGEASRVEPGFAEDRFSADSAPAQALTEMDPLFDDIPSSAGTGRARSPSAAGKEPEAEAPAKAPVQEELPELSLPKDPVSPELKAPELKELDLEQPIPVLFDEVNPRDNPELPADTLAAYRQSIDASAVPAESAPAPELRTEPQPKAEPQPEAEPLLEVEPQPGSTESSKVVPLDVQDVDERVTLPPLAPPDEEPAELEESAAPAAATPSSRGLKSMPDPEHVLIITVVGRNGQHLPGPALNKIVTACGMEWGDMAIYHRPEDNNPDAPIQFSMANAVAPGTFDPDNLEALETPAVTFFMSLDEPTDAMTAYECMLATAETLAKHLNGDLLDEDRSVMRPQTKEHYRERIRDFEMHQRQRRAN